MAPVNGAFRRDRASGANSVFGPSFAPASHSSSFDQRRRPEALRTAMATAFFWPTSTTSRHLSRNRPGSHFHTGGFRPPVFPVTTVSPPLRRGRRRRAASRQEIGPAAVGRGTGTGERSLHATIAETRRTLPKITGSPADPAAATLDVGRARSLSPARSRARPRQLCPGAASRVARRPHTPGDKEDEG